jgi:APA family basic amino acid/polyamine antiporter
MALTTGTPRIGLATASGLVVASMIGSGVFVTSGFMAKDLGPAAILIGWLVGGLLAACGAVCYAAVAAHLPKSGGEYRYLHDLYHPFAGYLAGWVSILFAFAAPIAMAAMAAGAYADVLFARGSAMPVALFLVIGLGIVQATGLRLGELVQNLGVGLKVLTILVFLGGALFSGVLDPARALPTASGLHGLVSLPFAIGQIYIGFAYAGWSAAVYMASEVKDPVRNVPKAMLVGCGFVTVLYLLLNFVFIAALSPADLLKVAHSQANSLTLGHLVAVRMLGETGGRLASGMVFLVLVSTICAMSMTGPRVCDEMARDGFLPGWARWKEGPLGGLGPVGLMTVLSAVMLVSNTFETLLNAVGVIIAVTGALSASAVIRIHGRWIPRGLAVALALFLVGVVWSVVGSLIAYPQTIGWAALTLGLASAFYAWQRRTSRAIA